MCSTRNDLVAALVRVENVCCTQAQETCAPIPGFDQRPSVFRALAQRLHVHVLCARLQLIASSFSTSLSTTLYSKSRAH
jgi:hypothetical protein